MAPPWLSPFRSALLQNRRQRTVQVATASAQDGPTVRTVILRRVQDDGTLVFFADVRSEKVAHLSQDDRTEVHTWWTKGRAQFRLRGRAQISTSDEDPIRQELWMDLREEDLVRFLGPPPGEEQDLESPLPKPPDALEPEDPRLERIAETFATVRVVPELVDVLVLDPDGHIRTRHILSEGRWSTTRVHT